MTAVDTSSSSAKSHKSRTLAFIFGSLGALSLSAQPVTVYAIAAANGGQTTPTQAILTYTAPSDSPCTIQVSESPTLSPLVHDVDPSLFPGANLDSRAGNLTNGLERTFVVGARRSDVATDNKLYSRALQANTQHYYQINCDSTSVAGQFMTVNPPLGNTYSDNPPFNAAGFGNYGWPTIDWTDQSTVYIDPLTGIAIKRFTTPGAFGYQGGSSGSQGGGALNVQYDSSATWTNPASITSGNSSTLATTATTNPIFVAWDNTNLNPDGAPVIGYYPFAYSIDSLQLNVFGNGTDSSSSNRTVQVCLVFYDSTTCNSAWQNIVVPRTLVSGAVSYPASTVFPNGGAWAGWGVTPPRSSFGVWATTVSVSGHTVTNTNGYFNTAWQSGAKYFIAGSSCTNSLCTISSVQTNESMTVVESPGSLTNVLGYSAAAGFLVRKSNSTGTVSISVASQYAVSYQNLLPGAGGLQVCEPNTVTVSYAADGVTPITPVPGELCLVNAVGPGADEVPTLYLLIPSTGEVRFINPLFADVTNGTSDDNFLSGIKSVWGAVDPTSPTTFYFSHVYGSGPYAGKVVIVKAQYQTGPECVFQAYGTGAADPPLYAPNGAYPGGQYHDSVDGLSACMLWTNVTLASAGRDLQSQIAARSNYKAIFGTASGLSNVNGGKGLVALGASSEGPALLYVFDLSTGNLVSASDTFSTYPLRWTAVHAAAQQASDRFMGIASSNGLGYYSNYVPDPTQFRGPYTTTPTMMFRGGVWSANTSIPADTSINIACPAGLQPALVAQGATGNNCIEFQAKMACNTNPYTGGSSGQTEAQAFPCPYNSSYSMLSPIGPGDFIRNLAALQSGGTVPYEYLQIVQATSLGSNNWLFVASRVATSGRPCDPNYPNPEAWLNGWTAVTVSRCDSDFFTDTTNLAGGYSPVLTGSHYTSGVGSNGENPTTVTAGAQGNPHYSAFQEPFFSQTSSYLISADVLFHGMEAPSQMQSYPSNYQLSVVNSIDKDWFLDFHHLNPYSGFGWEFPAQNETSFQTPATLVAGTNTVWKFAAPLMVVNFKIEPVVAYAGGYLLQDVSSPTTGNVITDSTNWEYCVVYSAGECRVGSAVGEAYMSVPQVGGAFPSSLGYCNSNTVSVVMPCANTLAGNAAQIIQSRSDSPDPNALRWRRLGFGLMGPGRQYEFSTAIPDPTGAWAVFACNWCDGVRNELFMAKLPPLPSDANAAQSGNDFQLVTVNLGANSELNLARVRFGYAENGHPSLFYCTTRQESCSTTADSSMPFAYESEGPVWHSCSAGCTIQVPALPGRVLYYAIDRQQGPSSGSRFRRPPIRRVDSAPQR
jgi:hypothetical protein